jgi:hypothetical protein
VHGDTVADFLPTFTPNAVVLTGFSHAPADASFASAVYRPLIYQPLPALDQYVPRGAIELDSVEEVGCAGFLVCSVL